MRALLLPALLLASCGGDTDTGAVDTLEPMVTGSISVLEADATGTVEFFHAYGIDQGGKAMIYISSNPDFNCDMAVEVLSDQGPSFDPTGYYAPGTCDLFIRLASDYTGDISGSDDPILRAGMTLNCFTGDGVFQWENRVDGGDDGYYWSGRKYQAYPTIYSFAMSGGDGSDYTIDLDFQEYLGSFPDEGEFTQYTATGAITGTVTAKWCSDLGSADRFAD